MRGRGFGPDRFKEDGMDEELSECRLEEGRDVEEPGTKEVQARSRGRISTCLLGLLSHVHI